MNHKVLVSNKCLLFWYIAFSSLQLPVRDPTRDGSYLVLDSINSKQPVAEVSVVAVTLKES